MDYTTKLSNNTNPSFMVTREEIMIGDWVYNKHFNGEIEPIQIHNIYGTEVNCKTERNRFDVDEIISGTYMSDLQPIPLIPEILEENGFKKGFLPALKTESSLLWVAKVGEDYIEIRFDRRNIAIWYDYDENGDGVYSDCLLPLPYWLHEFQHALKLCGINKEIEI